MEIAMKLLSVLAVGLMLAGPVSAQDVETAQAIAKSGDHDTAVKILMRLAEQGDGEATMFLAVFYFEGAGVLQDYDEGIRLLRLSASQGSTMSLGMLGNLYEEGSVVQQDNVTAHMWYNIFTVTNDDNSRADEARKVRDDITKKMTLDQIAEAQRRARVCMASNYQDCG
jgi:TPR repeat protein